MRPGYTPLILLALAAPAAALSPQITWDRRVDLVGLVRHLSEDSPTVSNAATADAARRFAPWAGHPAVRRLRAMRARGFFNLMVPQYAVYLSTSVELSEAYPAPEFFGQMAGGRAVLDAWRSELSDFARASDFDAWEREREPQREEELSAVRRAAGSKDLEAPLMRVLGLRLWDSWNVVVSPFYPPGGGAAWVLEQKPGLPDVYVISGAYGNRPYELPAWGFAAAAWPEALFTMVYAMYEACRRDFRPREDVCRDLTLRSVEDCVQAHWIWALMGRLLRDEYGPKAENIHRDQPRPPFAEQIAAALDAQLAARRRGADLMDAAPALAAPLSEDGKAPICLTVDPSRFDDIVYAQRIGYYLEARTKKRRDPAAAKALEALAPLRLRR